jgi:hypothetical protein
VANRIADAHRRIGTAEHEVEERLKAVARDLPDAELVEDGARELSRRADQHLRAADRIDGE